MATQQQALNTRFAKGRGLTRQARTACRMCIDAPETVQCIAAGWNTQAGTAITERYNRVTVTVLWHICASYGLDAPKSQKDTPMKVVEKKRYKITWDFKHWQNGYWQKKPTRQSGA